MNLKKNQKGFTIVELLIVVVVIAILAAISIVAYTGITNRANNSAAMEAANSVKSVAVAYQGANGAYPTTKALFVSGGTDPIAKLPADITFVTATSAAAATTAQAQTDPKSIVVLPHGSPITGFTIYYRDYTGTVARTMTAGDVSTAAAANALAN